MPDGLSKAPFEAIAHHGAAELTRHGKTDAGAGILRFPRNKSSE